LAWLGGFLETGMPAEAKDVAETGSDLIQCLMSLSPAQSMLAHKGMLTPGIFVLSARGDTDTYSQVQSY